MPAAWCITAAANTANAQCLPCLNSGACNCTPCLVLQAFGCSLCVFAHVSTCRLFAAWSEANDSYVNPQQYVGLDNRLQALLSAAAASLQAAVAGACSTSRKGQDVSARNDVGAGAAAAAGVSACASCPSQLAKQLSDLLFSMAVAADAAAAAAAETAPASGSGSSAGQGPQQGADEADSSTCWYCSSAVQELLESVAAAGSLWDMSLVEAKVCAGEGCVLCARVF